MQIAVNSRVPMEGPLLASASPGLCKQGINLPVKKDVAGLRTVTEGFAPGMRETMVSQRCRLADELTHGPSTITIEGLSGVGAATVSASMLRLRKDSCWSPEDRSHRPAPTRPEYDQCPSRGTMMHATRGTDTAERAGGTPLHAIDKQNGFAAIRRAPSSCSKRQGHGPAGNTLRVRLQSAMRPYRRASGEEPSVQTNCTLQAGNMTDPVGNSHE